MDKEDTKILYEEISKGAKRGIQAIDHMLKNCKNDKLRTEMLRTQKDYRYIAQDADVEIIRMGGEPEELSAKERLFMWGKVEAATFFDDSPERLSKMMLKGMKMAEKAFHKETRGLMDPDEEAQKLADRLLELQDKHRSVYRNYLR